MSRSIVITAIIAAAATAAIRPPTVGAQAVTDIDKLQAQIQVLREENWQLKLSGAQCQAKLAEASLMKEAGELQAAQAAFRADIRKKLGAKSDDEVDWLTLTLKKKTS